MSIRSIITRPFFAIGKWVVPPQPGHLSVLAAVLCAWVVGKVAGDTLEVVLHIQAVGKSAEDILVVLDRNAAGPVDIAVAEGPSRIRFESLHSGLPLEAASSHHPFASLQTTQRPWIRPPRWPRE